MTAVDGDGLLILCHAMGITSTGMTYFLSVFFLYAVL
jgi:hypothetical protein